MKSGTNTTYHARVAEGPLSEDLPLLLASENRGDARSGRATRQLPERATPGHNSSGLLVFNARKAPTKKRPPVFWGQATG